MSGIPKDGALDATVALMSEGYTFIDRRCRRLQSDVFETRLMLRPAICTKGEEAARMFYHPGRFTRKKAMPPTALKLLQDKGSVQLEEGADHRHRKEMFMSLMMPESIERIVSLMAEEWRRAVERWKRQGKVTLHDEVHEILCRAACRWAGIPLSDEEARQRTREFAAMIDGAGSMGPRNWRGMLLRASTERWLRSIVDDVRSGTLPVPQESPLGTVAWHRNRDGDLLDRKAAAVELANLVRPTVAIGRYITFAALALHDYPESRKALLNGEDIEPFVQEVRRFYPFFPFIGGRVKEPFEWRGGPFEEGAWVLLDLYSTNRDERTWDAPETFRPGRFRDWEGHPYRLIPQGAGDHHETHRCPGEWTTIALLKEAVRLLVHETSYEVPAQDLSIDLSRMPAKPASGLKVVTY